jgi:hypothetical protein
MNRMRHADLDRLLKRRPFRPFRITVSTGETFDVPHPEMLFLAEKFVAVTVPKLAGEMAERHDFVWIDLLHIVHLLPLQRTRPSPETTNHE